MPIRSTNRTDLAANDDGRLDFRTQAYASEFTRSFEFRKETAQSKRLKPYQSEAVASLLSNKDPSIPALLHLATGAGKTLVANNVVSEVIKSNHKVLWVANRWELLYQAAQDFANRFPIGSGQQTRIGGDGNLLHPMPESLDGSIIYTTLSTIVPRLQSLATQGFRPGHVIWDECHYGDNAKSGDLLMQWCRARSVSVSGLTATPRPPSESHFRVVYRKDFFELLSLGFLAKPIVSDPVRTGIPWNPVVAARQGDVSSRSLAQLGANDLRNKLILDHYVKNASEFGKTIVFACSIGHANDLARRLCSEYGIAARPIHSHLTERDSYIALRAFERGAISVLVNVEKLTHGIDIPDTKTIFLCRPTFSDILFAQMIGRGSRLHSPSGKKDFYVVDFIDNVGTLGDQLVKAKQFFLGGSGGRSRGSSPPSDGHDKFAPVTARHSFNAKEAPLWTADAIDNPVEMRNLWIMPSQTFGVELEISSSEIQHHSVRHPEWLRCASQIWRCLRRALPEQLLSPGIGGNDHRVWNVKHDGSCGWEVSSRILQGEKGFLEIAIVCAILCDHLEDFGLRVSHKTGMHLHIGWPNMSLDHAKRLIRLVKYLEPSLATLVAPSRVSLFDGATYRTSIPNHFCRPIAATFSDRWLTKASSVDSIVRKADRYSTVNLSSLARYGTVEVRLHNGTLNAAKILLWTSLWQQIAWVVRSGWEIPGSHDERVLRPVGDIVTAAKNLLPGGVRPQFLERLNSRRLDILEIWKTVPELQTWAELGSWIGSAAT